MTQSVGFTLSAPPKSLQTWCDAWNKASFKAGVRKTKLVAKSIGRPSGGLGALNLALLRIGEAPIVYPFRGLPLEQITEEYLRTVTISMMETAGIVNNFPF
jgi:hypothetical protein